MQRISRRQAMSAIGGAAGLAFTGGCGSPASVPASKQSLVSGSITHLLEGVGRENIKITDVKVTPMSWVHPQKNIWRSIDYIVWKTDSALCRIYTDAGIVGIGEGSPYAGPDKIQKFTEDYIKPALVGRNPFDVELLTCGGTSKLARRAWAGADVALWDIIGRAKNMPVYKLLATDTEPVTRIPIYASGGDEHEWYNKGDEFLIEEALRYKEHGFTAMKFRIGTDWAFSNMTFKRYIPIMQRLRDAVGSDFKLMHETVRNTGHTQEDVVNQFCPAIEELGYHWFEQPMKTLEQHLEINQALDKVMVSGGESDSHRFELLEWIDRGALDIVQSDCNCTGLTENWYIARMAHLKGKIMCPHNWHGGLTTIGNAHLVAAIPNRHMLEVNQTLNPFKEDIFKDPLVVKNGFMDLPDRPGFGMELIDDMEKKFPWEPGKYQRPNPKIVKG
jgi:L-alanine-DL-glutamate epimerase-like enolase superfamily enzyme